MPELREEFLSSTEGFAAGACAAETLQSSSMKETVVICFYYSTRAETSKDADEMVQGRMLGLPVLQQLEWLRCVMT
eukprot:1160382-Pelagomonas_calceolata.AAC.11